MLKLECLQPLKNFHNAGFSSAIIAGGFIRDDYHGVDFKDVDIYIWDPSCSQMEPSFNNEKHSSARERLVSGIFNINPTSSGRMIMDSVEPIVGLYGVSSPQKRTAYHPHKIIAAYEIWKSDIQYQVMFTRVTPIEHVTRFFDIGLCKAYTDGKRIHYTDDFLTDSNNKTITVVGEDMSQDEIDQTKNEHIPRLLRKYPGYTVKYI